jgi:cytochrome b involved in lipid metabolism
MHPGGKKVIEEHLGKSIDQPFDDTGHSKSAKSYFGTRLP